MKYQYLFILGSHPALSVAELTNILPEADYSLRNGILYYAGAVDQDMIKRLGGTVKIARILTDSASEDISELARSITDRLKPQDGKFKIGFSVYPPLQIDSKRLGMTVKNVLKESGQSVRWVTSRDEQLSSVVVEQNGLLKNGAEIILTRLDRQVIIAQTIAVQLFKELSYRDYGRPDRDDHSGMLPPKLAQIMLNLAGASPNDAVMDPFCGSGTILTEAILMGYHKIFGSDLSAKAVADSQKNVDWIREKFGIDTKVKSLVKLDAAKLAASFAPASVRAIVTEPFLGPQRGRIDAAAIIEELNGLYSRTLDQFSRLLADDGRIVMIWPALTERDPYPKHFLSPDQHGLKTVPPLPEQLLPGLQKFLSPRGHLLYGRPGQKVWREVVLLEKQ